MKSLKNVALFAIIFAGNTFPMRMTEMGQKGAKSKVRHFLSYFIYSLETTEGIWISKKIAEENSEYIKMLSQRSNANKIGLPFSIELIKLAFNILSHPTYIKN